jgi:CheY-like chemotaxis protein
LVDSKRQMLATISHEIRTPLHSILSNATELALKVEGRDGFEEVAVLLNDSSHLVDLTNDVLDLTKMEDEGVLGSWIPSLTPVAREDFVASLDSLAKGVVSREDVYGGQEKTSSKVAIRVDATTVPDLLMLDRARTLQILINFVSNAIKYGGSRVEVSIHVVDADSVPTKGFGDLQRALQYLQFDVVDIGGSGIGTAEEAALFSIFAPGMQHVSKQGRVSLGLGLAICRLNAQRLRGMVKYARDDGAARTTFSLVVPLVAIPECASQPAPSPRLSAEQKAEVSILLVDDEPMNLKIAGRMLKTLGFDKVDTASNLTDAVKLISKNDYQLLLLDFQLSNSETALDLLHEVHVLGRRPQFGTLLQSAHATREVRESAAAAGCAGFLLKPYTKGKLETALEAVIDGKGTW